MDNWCEIHITVLTKDELKLSEDAKSLGLEVHIVVLDKGINAKQLMLSKKFLTKCSVEDLKTSARKLAIKIFKLGHKPIRIKVEERYPGTKDALYYEVHYLFHVDYNFDWSKFKILIEGFDAHFSKNPAKVDRHGEYRYLTIREKNFYMFDLKSANFLALLSSLGLPYPKSDYEIVLMDTNIDLDKGWLYATGRDRETL